MIAYRSLLSGFLLVVCTVSLAWAQAPRVVNAPLPDTGFLRTDGGSEPDTTAPWRYFPLAVGDVWEYANDEGALRRRTVEKDTVALGHRYFIVRQETAIDGEVISAFRQPLRFDTTSSIVRSLIPTDPPSEIDYYGCPLDAPFDTTIECRLDGQHAVTGTYDGVLVFGGEGPGTGTDTVRTAVKRYASTQTGFEIRYGADVGIVYEEGDGFFRALTYYRVGGEEHGVEQFPVAAEPVPSAGPPVASLEAWPNPSRGRLTMSAQLPDSVAEGELVVYDVVGRTVWRVRIGPGGASEYALDLSSLPAGSYALVLQLEGTRAAVRFITLVE